jgi:Na+/H+ antiporter NhaD/arsenite permease-like protein
MVKTMVEAHRTASLHSRSVLPLVVALVLIFIVIYALIALEHPLKISKSASALLGAGLLWTVYALSVADHGRMGHELDETVTATARITFFLLGAMTIVEVIDAHDGFALITSRIRTRQQGGLLGLVAWVTFFLSAILDNLTTAIVMVSLMRKVLNKADDRLVFASVIVIATARAKFKLGLRGSKQPAPAS